MSEFFTNKQLYELRKGWLNLAKAAEKLKSLSQEEAKKLNLPTDPKTYKFEVRDAGKFIEDYYNYLFLTDNSAEPLERQDINELKRQARELFNQAANYYYGRDCYFDWTPVGLSSTCDSVYLLTRAIEKANDEIKPDHNMYDRYKMIYKGVGEDAARKLIDEDIARYNSAIKMHDSNLSSMGYEHYEDTEMGYNSMDQEEYEKRCDEEYKHIERLKGYIATLEGYKEKLKLDDENKAEQQDEPNKPQNENKRTQKRKPSILKRIAAAVRRKKDGNNKSL